MFGLDLTPDQQKLIDEVGRLATAEIRPGRCGPDDLRARLLEICPTADDPVTAVAWAEEVAFGDPGIAYDAVLRAAAGEILSGPPGGERWRGGAVALAYFEGFGRAASELATTARRTAYGWTVTGHKIGVLEPDSDATQLVIARDPDSGVLRAVVVHSGRFVVERDDVAEGKLGLEAARTGSIRLDVVAVVPDAVLDGGTRLNRAVQVLRLRVAAVALGAARAALAHALDYANSRQAFGQPIARFQGVSFPLVEADTALAAARLVTWRAAAGAREATDVERLEREVGEAVAQCQSTALQATRVAVNTLGGHGYMLEHPVEHWYRDVGMLAALDFDALLLDLDVF